MPLSLCAITGTVYTVGGIAAPGVTVYCHRVIKSGTIIESIQRLVATSDVNGAVSFSLPRAATAYLFAEAEGLDADEQNGTAFSIPDAASATLESLLPPVFPITQESFTFLSLLDTPDTFVGQALKFPRVNAGETALEFATVSVSVTAEEIQDALVNFFPDVAPFDWTYDDAGDRVTLTILDATSGARGLMSTAYAARLDALEVGDSPTFAGLSLGGDVNLEREAADTLALRRALNSQIFRGYRTFTDASNYQRWALSNSATQVILAAESAGTGAANIDIQFTGKGTGALKFNSVFTVTSSGHTTVSGDLSTTGGNIGMGNSGILNWPGTGLVRAAAALIGLTNASSGGAGFEFTEVADFAAGATNKARLYARDNGSGKTQLVVIFPTGVVQVLATEP